MKKYNNVDLLKSQIKNDLMKAIRDDSSEIVDGISHGINELIDSTNSNGSVKTTRTDKGASMSVKVRVPSDSASSFVSGVDNVVKSVFKFSKWSDMEI